MTIAPTMAPWSIDAWCDSQPTFDWRIDCLENDFYPESTLNFLQRLNLSSIHPFCSDIAIRSSYALPNVPGQGPLLSKDHLETAWDVVVTVIAMGLPSLAAMAELWLRLFSSMVAPLGVAHLLYLTVFATSNSSRTPSDNSSSKARTNLQHTSPIVGWMISITCLLTTASAIVLMTDTLYVLEFGPSYGASLLILSLLSSRMVLQRYQLQHRYTVVYYGMVALVVLAITLVCNVPWSSTSGDFQSASPFSFGDARDAVQIEEGLYFDESNHHSRQIVSRWSESFRLYTPSTGATPWLPTGDSRTGIPFLLNFVETPKWTRVWLPLVHDGEVVALDIAFPQRGHDTQLPLYLVLHGLNGGSQEEYVKDFVVRRVAEGSTVAVMIARGLMDLPVRGMNVFHGARWQDPHQAAQQLRKALVPGQVLAGVGYSMGAIILSNMVARTGSECALDVAVAVSGGLDMRQEINFVRAQRLWQPLLTAELRDTFVVGKWGERVRQRLTKDQLKALMRATHVSDIDETAVVVYNGFRDLVHYYSEMSALGDVPYPSSEYYSQSQLPSKHRIHNVSIPFCVIHALDDPLVTWRSVAANQGLMHPTNLTKTGAGNLFILLTKRGGHVGWPLGWNPSAAKWKWMSDASMSFVEAFRMATSRQEP